MITFDRLGKAGRLGNALFEFAATVGLADLHGDVARFNADWEHRPFFSIPNELFEPCVGGTPADQLVPHIDPRAAEYLQDVNLFVGSLPKIRTYLQPRSDVFIRGPLQELQALAPPVLSVHVRRQDKVPGQDLVVRNNGDYHLCAELDYYERAIKEMQGEYKSVAAFSDEPRWVREHLNVDWVYSGVPRPKESEPLYAETPIIDWVDLYLMAACDAHIVTGSTFGIWGALLADSQTVIRPDKVYGPLLSFIDENLLFLPDWKVIPLAC